MLVEEIISPNEWIAQIFEATAARTGGIVRRSVESVERFAGHAQLVMAVQAREFHMDQIGDQYLIYCTQCPMIEHIC